MLDVDDVDKYEENKKEIGNYFKTKEEAEKAVEKLKAWKRLKEHGFCFYEWDTGEWRSSDKRRYCEARFSVYDDDSDDSQYDLVEDLELIFGGEE